MDAINGIDNGKTSKGKAAFDLFKPVSVRDGKRIESSKWAVRFQHQGKRTCRSTGTADFRLAQQRAKALVTQVRSFGWSSVTRIRGDQSSILIEDLITKFKLSAAGRGVRPRSTSWESYALSSLAREIGAKRVADITSEKVQLFISGAIADGGNPESIKGLVKSAKIVFSKASLQSMDLSGLANPFTGVVMPKLDTKPFNAPAREAITSMMADGLKQLDGPARVAFVLALGCGLRWGEIASLDWSNVLGDRVRVLASIAKGRRQREVPCGAHVQTILATGRQLSGPVLPDPESTHDVVTAWLRTRDVIDAKPCHWLRKCFGSLAVADHGLFVGSMLFGHADVSITARTYANIIDALPAVNF
jgi:integrase